MAELHSSSDTAGKSPSGWCDESSNLLVDHISSSFNSFRAQYFPIQAHTTLDKAGAIF